MESSEERDLHHTKITADIADFNPSEPIPEHETVLARLDRKLPTSLKVAMVAVAAAGTLVYMVKTGFQA